jgi:hypothetical protein
MIMEQADKVLIRIALAAALIMLLLMTVPSFAQFAEAQPGGPVAIGQQMAQVHPGTGGVAIVQAPAVAAPSGGVIQLSVFGWLQPYVDSLVQALLAAGLAWIGKSKYTQWMDQSARDALGTFTKNAASSLIADGFVHMQGKTVSVPSAAIATEVSTAMDRIPDAMKRFGLTPGALTQKIIDAIPQTTAGAALIVNAHAAEPATQLPPTVPA